ncbi:MAG: RDD family protein [Chitinophagaceae bacterium]|nr:RDD family protein [Chitinophagaceae bacterium]
MALIQVKTPFNVELQFEAAPFHFRLFAWLLDLVILIFFSWGMSTFLENVFGSEIAGDFGFTELLLVTPYIMYHVLFEVFNKGQSLGKMALGIQVISASGESATVGQSLLRWLLRFVDFGCIWGGIFMISQNIVLSTILIIGCLIAFVLFVSTPMNQRLGDLVAGTVVVMKRLPYKLSDTIFQDLSFENYTVTFPQVMRLSDKDINIVDHIVKQHNKNQIGRYLENVSVKIKTVLNIETDLPDDMFLETLLRDYNYLSRK